MDIIENPTSKKCEDCCPNCGADYEDITWGLFVADEARYQPADCNICGCHFKEYYTYCDTEFEVGAVDRIPCEYPMNEFYQFKDEVPKGARASNPDTDCKKCEEKECDLRHCLIICGEPQQNPKGENNENETS
jgi:hypothetical protein